MTAYLKMDKPLEHDRLEDMAQGVIGQPLDRPEGPLKVSGRATFANEHRIENLAYGVLVRAKATTGKVSRVDAKAVKAMEGVLAVITDERLLRNPAQGTANEAPAQGCTDVAYFGQLIALVVAESFEQARHGAQTLAIEIDGTQAAVNPEADDTTVEDAKNPTSQGDLEQAMKDAAHSIDEIYRTPGHSSAAMEPHASIAMWEGDDLILHGSYQMLKYNRNELADSLGIDPKNIRIRAPYIGGGFGAKLGISQEAVAASIAAKQLGRPVSVALSRQQVFEATMRRSESRQRIRLAADAEGRLTGIGHESLVSNLPDESFTEPVGQGTHFLYRGANREIGERTARIHRSCAGSVRAPGEAIGVVVLENAMDELALKMGIDPVELRKRNIPEIDPEKDKPFSSRRFADCLDKGAKEFGWATRKKGGERDGEWLIGTGMASAARVNMLMESAARVTLGADVGPEILGDDPTELLGRAAITSVMDLLEEPGDRLGENPQKMRDDLLLTALTSAVAETTELLGSDMDDWRWGDLHRGQFTSAVAPLASNRMGEQLNVGPLSMGGSAFSPRAASYNDDFEVTSGASFRMVLDVGNWDESRFINTPGQSGDPMNAHYRDLAPLWAAGKYAPLVYSREAVERAADHVITMKPGG